jgi:hypothetical protein
LDWDLYRKDGPLKVLVPRTVLAKNKSMRGWLEKFQNEERHLAGLQSNEPGASEIGRSFEEFDGY